MKKFIGFLCIFILFHSNSFSQGCSDAGFCTMGAMKPNQRFNKKLSAHLRSIEFSQYIGVNKVGDIIMSYTTDINIGIFKRTTVQLKVPYMFCFGQLANTNGLGDLSVSATQNLVAKEKYQLNFTLGAKIPTNNGSKSINNRPLPNYYQSSLGTYDFVVGISFITKKWLIAAGYQQPLNSNGNQFVWGPWNNSGSVDSAIAREYPKCRDLKRGNDIMFRIERDFRFSRFSANIGLLPIYRLTEDVFLDADGKRKSQPGTKGLAMTLIGGFGYNFSARSGIKFAFGYRVTQRYSAPELHELSLDGLSREFVNTIGYEFRF